MRVFTEDDRRLIERAEAAYGRALRRLGLRLRFSREEGAALYVETVDESGQARCLVCSRAISYPTRFMHAGGGSGDPVVLACYCEVCGQRVTARLNVAEVAEA